MKIEMTHAENLEVFGVYDSHSIQGKGFIVNGVKFHCLEFCRDYSVLSHYPSEATIHLTLVKAVKVKSLQQVFAEESVKKAEDALKAAKEVLNKVKEV